MSVGAALLALRWLAGGRRLEECTVFGMVEALHCREEGVAAERRVEAASGLAQGRLRAERRGARSGGRVHAVEELHAEDGERDSHAGRHRVTLCQELIDSDGHRAAHEVANDHGIRARGGRLGSEDGRTHGVAECVLQRAERGGGRRAEGAQAEEKHSDGTQRRAHDLDIARQHGQGLRGGVEGEEAQRRAEAGESRLFEGCHGCEC